MSSISDQVLAWDAASNLIGLDDQRSPSDWPVGARPQSVEITHDALYHVIGAHYSYGGTEPGTDWRSEAAASNASDPMHPQPAARVGALPAQRVQDLSWEWDWLGNTTSWGDDAWSFYERSLGELTNGRELALRPSALYVATNIDTAAGIEAGWGGAGWVEVDYGVSGNVTSYTVHGQCDDIPAAAQTCSDAPNLGRTARIAHLRANCACATEQHYQYRWDELNRLVDARRFDRSSGSSTWALGARLRYRYDGANQRTAKQTFTGPNAASRVALYVYPGDYERRGLVQSGLTYSAVTAGVDATETQYVVAGARIVWDASTSPTVGTDLDRNRRITVPISTSWARRAR